MGLFTDALHFAVDAHGDARRKGDGAPAILHATEAASIAATLTTDERVLATRSRTPGSSRMKYVNASGTGSRSWSPPRPRTN